MLGFITRAVFGLQIEERNGTIRISGIRTHDFIDDISKTFGTSRVTTHMLTKATRTYVEFYSFFAIDVEYIIRKLASKKNTRLGKRGYTKMREALVENTWLNKLDEKHPSIFNKSKLKEIKFDLLKHQSEFIDYYDNVIPKYNLKGILMAATPGSGKTISSIAIACAFESKNVIVISPKNAVFRVWEKTLKEDMNVDQTVWVHASKKPMPSPSENRWFIFHYESLGDAVALASKLSSQRCTIILDESHNLNEMKSLRTERFVSMCKSMKNSLVVELSGTPMKAMGSEAIPLISAIDPLFTDACVEKFKKIYGREAKAATEILANRLGIIMYKVNKEESKIEEPVEHTIKVEVKDSARFTLEVIKKDMADFIKDRTEYYTKNKKHFNELYFGALKEFEANGLKRLKSPEQYDTYKTYINEFIKRGYDPMSSAPKALYCNEFEKKVIQPTLTPQTKRDFKMAKSVVKYVNLKIRGECLGTVLSRARTQCNKAILDSLDLAALIDGAEKKTLVFTSYVEIVKAAEVKLKQQGYSPLTVFAETNNQLPAMVKAFGNDETINPMIATYQSLSTAVPLTMANRVVLLNSPFRIHEKEQTVARANRIGQDKTVDVYNILLDTGDVPNISTRSSEIMEWSREQVNAIMGFDNMDNAPGLESYQEEECMYDLDNVIKEEEVEDIKTVSVESVDVTPPLPPIDDDTEVSLESKYTTLMNAIETSNEFISIVNSNLNKGKTLTPQAMGMYRTLYEPSPVVSIEANQTRMMFTSVSLESEVDKKKGFIRKLIEILKKMFKAAIEYFTDVNRVTRKNIDAAVELKRLINRGKIHAFNNAVGQVKVEAPHWLVRNGKVSPEQCLRDLKWQSTNVTFVKAKLNQDVKLLINDFDKRLKDIYSTPGLNQITHIANKLRTFTSLMFESSSTNLTSHTLYTTKPMMGGRTFILKFPNGDNSSDLLRNYNSFSLKKGSVSNEDSDPDNKITALTGKQAVLALDYVIEINKQLTHISSLLNSAGDNYDSFLNRVTAYADKFKGSNDSDYLIFDKQISLMLSGLKAQLIFSKNYVDYNDRSSRAVLRYVRASAEGHVEK